MGLFGSAASTKTKVRPAWQTEQILRDVVQRSKENDQNQRFIGHQMADLSSDQRGALAQLAASPELQRAASLLGNQTTQGLNNLSASNQGYRDVLNSGVTAQGARDFSNEMTGAGSLSARSLQQGTGAGNAVSRLGGNAALRSAGRFNTSNINATAANQRGQQMTGLGINTQLGNNRYLQDVSGMQSGLANTNLNLGAQGINLGQQAIQNQLQAGNFQQQYQNALNQNNWQNSMGQQMFDWNKINNQLNVLNEVSPMAGYTATNTTAAPSQASQLYGAGLSALGTYGKLGGFNSMDSFNSDGSAANPFLNHASTAANQPGGGPTQPTGAGNYGGMFGGIANWFGGS